MKFINEWHFSFRTNEKFLINGEVVSSTDTDIKSGKRNLSGRHFVEYSCNDTKYRIEVVLGSKWPGIFLGCHFYVNGELIGGDVGSKLMFT